MTTHQFQAELQRKIDEKRQARLTRADIKEATALQREIKKRLRTYCDAQEALGWPDARPTDVTRFGLVWQQKVVRLTYLSGTPFTLPLEDTMPDCIYVGDDRRLYVANHWIWDAPHKSLTPFLQLRLSELYDLTKLRGMVWSLSLVRAREDTYV